MQHLTDPDRYRVAAIRCHDRFCKPCGDTRAALIRRNLISRLHDEPHRFLTLTMKASKTPLDLQLNRLLKSFARLRNTTLWKDRVLGGAAFLELTYNPQASTWHPHLHVILQGKFIAKADLTASWLRITGDSFVLDIKYAPKPDRVANYIAKYATKPLPPSIVNSGPALREALTALQGRKMLYTFGTWAKWQLLSDPDDREWKHYAYLAELRMNDSWNNRDTEAILEAAVAYIRNKGPQEFEIKPHPPPDCDDDDI